ncbi:MAG: alpha-2-macroglobulin family protein, partial [Gammaproteobacteria bacterium]|nr:alpha-2-macroglobulin family protein [Gammaproteobacteria bacterium]
TQSPVRLRLSANLLESGGRPVTRHYNLTSLTANKLVGIRPVYNSGLDHFEANTLANFEIVRVNEKAQSLQASGLQVKLIHERRDYHWVNRGAGWSYEFNEKHYTAFETTLDISAGQSRGELKLPVEWGQYRLEITDPETKLTASTRITAGSTWWGEQDQASQGTRPDQIKLSWDKASYKAGETAQLTLLPPYAGEGFIVVESDRPLWGQRITLPLEGMTINIPVTTDWKRPDIYATAVIFRPSSQADLITPKRALGLLHLPLDHSQQLLQLEISSPDKIEPNKKLKIQIKADNIQNKQVRIQLMAVDVGVLNITKFESPDPHQWLFEPRRLRVESHDMYGDIVEYLKANLARQKFGGDADLAQGGEQAKADVQIVSLLHPLVDFDENGQADFEFDIPDFNGRLRIMAVAFGENQFGAVDKEINVAAPIIAEIAMPRFIARNDQAHITLELQNLTEKEQSISTTLHSSAPLEISTSAEHQVTLTPKQRKLLHYQVTAKAYGKGQLTLNLNNADNSIQLLRKWALTSRSPYPTESYKFSQVIEKGETVSLQTQIAEKLIPSGTAASLSVSDQAPIDVSAHVSNLLQYPYGCLEQTSSRVYPLLFADKQAIKRWQLDDKDWT